MFLFLFLFLLSFRFDSCFVFLIAIFLHGHPHKHTFSIPVCTSHVLRTASSTRRWVGSRWANRIGKSLLSSSRQHLTWWWSFQIEQFVFLFVDYFLYSHWLFCECACVYILLSFLIQFFVSLFAIVSCQSSFYLEQGSILANIRKIKPMFEKITASKQ